MRRGKIGRDTEREAEKKFKKFKKIKLFALYGRETIVVLNCLLEDGRISLPLKYHLTLTKIVSLDGLKDIIVRFRKRPRAIFSETGPERLTSTEKSATRSILRDLSIRIQRLQTRSSNI